MCELLRSRRRVIQVLVPLLVLAVLTISPALLAADPAPGGEESMAAKVQHALKTSFWALLAFAVVFWILWKKLFPPIIHALDERARKIQDALDAAKKAKEEAEALMAQNEENLDKARQEAREIIEEARQDALKVKNGIVEEARQEAEAITDRGLRELDQAKKNAIDDLYRQAASLSFDLAEKVIHKSLDASDHQALVDSTIASYREID